MFLKSTISAVILALFFVVSCSTELGQVEPLEINQQAEIDLLKQGKFDIDFLKDLFSDEYDEPVEGIGWKNGSKRSVIDSLKAIVRNRWNTLIRITGLSREQLRPYYDRTYLASELAFKSTFLDGKYYQTKYLTSLPNTDGTLRPKGISEYTCHDIAIYHRIKGRGLWRGYGYIDYWPGYTGKKPNSYVKWDSDRALEAFWGILTSKKHFLLSNGEFTYLRKLKLRQYALDYLIYQTQNHGFEIIGGKQIIWFWGDINDHKTRLENAKKRTKEIFNKFENEVLNAQENLDCD